MFDNKFRQITDESPIELDLTKSGISAGEKPKDIIHKLLILACKDRSYILKLKRYILDYYVDKIAVDKAMKSYENPGQRTCTLSGVKERDILSIMLLTALSHPSQ